MLRSVNGVTFFFALAANALISCHLSKFYAYFWCICLFLVTDWICTIVKHPLMDEGINYPAHLTN